MDLLQTILSALNDHYGRRETPGWVILFTVIIGIGSAMSARELLQRRSRLKQKSLQALNQQKILKALIFRNTDSTSEKVEGSLKWTGQQYVLNLHQENHASTNNSLELSFSSWDEVARYLENNSILRIGDFK